jgi:hypothetical protein
MHSPALSGARSIRSERLVVRTVRYHARSLAGAGRLSRFLWLDEAHVGTIRTST